jgi:hypothetical protein
MQRSNLSKMVSKIRALAWSWRLALGASSIALMCLITLGFTSTPPAWASERSPQEAVRSFLEMPREQIITRLEVYYESFSSFTSPINEAALRHNRWECKVVIRFPHIRDISRALEGFKFRSVPKDTSNIKLACVFYDNREKEVLCISFGSIQPVVNINGEPFQASPELLLSALAFIPHEAHQHLLSEFTSRWIDMAQRRLEELRSSGHEPADNPADTIPDSTSR